MAVTFPSSPTNGQTFLVGNVTYTYSDGMWSSQIGSTNSSSGAASVTAYTNLAAFPSSDNTAGDMGFAEDTKALYVWDGEEWDRISSDSDESPIVTTEPATSHDLNKDGTTSTVTMVAEDPEGFDIEYDIRYNTSGNTLPPQLASATTINQSTGVFTFTPSTSESDTGSFNARLMASDGNRVTVRTIPINLAFGLSNVYGFRFVQTSYSWGHTVFNTLILGATGEPIHDETGFDSEASWSPTPSWSVGVANAVTDTTNYYGKFYVDEALATFGVTLSSFSSANVSESGVNVPMDLKWTTPRTIRGILISGDDVNNYDYWTNGYVQAYIGGNTASDLDPTQYTFVDNTVGADAPNKFYDFR
jgi:hypothetical protein